MTPYYQEHGVTLYCANSASFLPLAGGAAVADVAITDPPYDERTHANARTTATADKVLVIGFDPADPSVLGPALVRAAKRWAVAFCSMEMLGAYAVAVGPDRWVRSGFWHRPDGTPQITGDRPAQPGEGIAIMHRSLDDGRVGRMRWNGGGNRAYWSCNTVKGSERVHETQKPLDLMRALVRAFSDPDEVVLDPFCGSGTTLAACKMEGRQAIGIELVERHCESAAKRLETTLVTPRFAFEREE